MDLDRYRLAELERRVAKLEGKPDSGLPCSERDCYGGLKKWLRDGAGRYTWVQCPRCNGTSRIYPSME